MDAHKAGISDIFTSMTLIEVPFFQRAYVWKDDLWERFLEDMEYVTQTNKTHFFGSIILKDAGKVPVGANYSSKKTIVDGQQRLTTFLIFMKVLCLKTGQTALFDYNFKNMNQDIKLLHSKNDKEAFDKVVSSKDLKLIENTDPISQIISSYNFFVEHIDITKLNIMTILSNIQFVKIDLDEDEDEQQIFDTINSLGVDLTTAELLKNYFFNRESIKEYEEKWVSIFEKDDEAKIYWNTVIETGRVKKALIDIFFEAYFEIFIQNKKYSISNEDKIAYARVDELAQSYKNFIYNYCNGDKQEILKELKEYATCFRNTFNPDYCNMGIPGYAGIERINIVIFGLKNSTMIPYVLYIAKNIEDQDELIKIYGLLESYMMRRITVHASTKYYNKFFPSLINNAILDYNTLKEKLFSSQEETVYVPNDEELRDGFEKSKLVNLQTKGIIYLIESAIRPSKLAATSLLGFNSYSLEHLMPKKWRNNWDECGSIEDERNRDNKLLTLGNLAIITQSLNSSIRDANWKTKRAGKGNNKPGLDQCAAGLQTMHFVLQKNSWTEEDIENRAKWLFEQAKDLWQIDK